MPENIVDDGSTFPTVTTPLGAESRTASSLKATVQLLANRAKYLYNAIFSTGVPRIATAADLAALAAISVSSSNDGDVRYVPGLGLYRFSWASTSGAETYFVIVPGGGTGRWIHELAGVVAAASGIATLDGSSKLVQKPTNALIGVGSATGASFTTNSASGVDVTGSSVSLSAATGDVLEVEATARARVDAGAAWLSIAITDGVTTYDELTTPYGGASYFTNTSSGPTSGMIKSRTIVTAGTVIAKLKALNTLGNNTTVEAFTIRARVIRP